MHCAIGWDNLGVFGRAETHSQHTHPLSQLAINLVDPAADVRESAPAPPTQVKGGDNW